MAVEAEVDPRTVKAVLAGQSVRPLQRARVLRAINRKEHPMPGINDPEHRELLATAEAAPAGPHSEGIFRWADEKGTWQRDATGKTTQVFPLEAALRPEVEALRAELQAIQERVWTLLQRCAPPDPNAKVPQILPGEVFANRTLAVRHIEDARMRLGKVLQHSRDGVSIYDNKG